LLDSVRISFQMFGFLGSPCRSCASQNDLSTYRSFFCGLSGALRDDYSPAARFLVNRDSTFLSLLTASINPAPPAITMRTCCNPIAVPRPLFSNDLHSRYAAAVTICGLSAKLDDDREDETGIRKNAARLLGRALGPMTDRAISFLNSVRFPTAEVVEMMAEQSAIESSRPDLLTAASPTAAAYGTIFGEAARLAGAPRERGRLEKMGQNLGRLIYWKDAYDDRKEDAQKGRFNPLERAEEGEFESHFSDAFTNFQEITSLPGTFQITVGEVCSSTAAKHQGLMPDVLFSGPKEPKPRRERDRSKKSFCDRYCPCDCCHCGNSACDCGPGDSGCIDCDCCPCS
jgi:hypothetical protein